MAVDVKKIMAEGLLELCEEKPLAKITVGDIQQKTGVSRQTFYKHFQDKDDLIQYIYRTKIISYWKSPTDDDFDFAEALVACYEGDVKYRRFMKQAVMLGGQNCLRDYMVNFSNEFDCAWLEHVCGIKLTTHQRMVSYYHSAAAMYVRIRWILDNENTSPLDMAKFAIQPRTLSLDGAITGSDCSTDGPYKRVLDRLNSM